MPTMGKGSKGNTRGLKDKGSKEPQMKGKCTSTTGGSSSSASTHHPRDPRHPLEPRAGTKLCPKMRECTGSSRARSERSRF